MAEKTPLDQHQKDYKLDAWKAYTLQELGNFVHLFHKRSTHRNDIKKIKKDLHDAKNYLWMMEQELKNTTDKLHIKYSDL